MDRHGAGCYAIGKDSLVATIEPSFEQVLDFCARDPVERVFLEDVARRGLGRFHAVEARDGTLASLCHVGANLVPSGESCGVYAAAAAGAGSRMVIGDECAVDELWAEARNRMPIPREDRPGQPVYAITSAPDPGDTGLRDAELSDLDLLVPVCAAAHAEELGIDPLARDPEGFRWRTRAQIDERRSWVWVEDGVIRFKAEASAWTPAAVQVQQVWVDPAVRGQGFGSRGMRDLIRTLLEKVPTVTLFVRTDNQPAIRLYESVGMEHVGSYRSILF
jgi:ribosomal protein S18 acetylase RimI-like enzyme